MKLLKSLLGSNRKSKPVLAFYETDRNRFSKTMPGESAALASVRLGCMSL